MSLVQPKVHLRLGSHAEKEYVEKTLKRFDGLIVGGNLLEATPGATASLIVKLCGKTSGVSYLIDPMTYAFGAYVDPVTGKSRADLDWIKSDQKVKGQKGKVVRAIKSSYQKLSGALGPVFSDACSTGKAVEPSGLASSQIRSQVAEAVLEYQMTRIRDVFASDPEYKDIADEVPLPAALLAPYFYIEPSKKAEWSRLSWLLAAEAVKRGKSLPVHAVVCAPKEYLSDDSFLNEVVTKLPQSKVAGVWLWFSRFDERLASEVELLNFKKLVSALGTTMQVANMHGGFFSLALSRHGMSGIAHGVGYGEQKDVVPVIGQSTPTVRYYLPPIYARFGVPDIERCFSALGVTTPKEFFRKICDCVVCRGVIASSLSNFREFGDRHYSTPISKRAAQTPAAAKRCRFHFLLCRLRERDWIADKTNDDVIKQLSDSVANWKSVVVQDLRDGAAQVERWGRVLGTS
jgi:hypothetical protein